MKKILSLIVLAACAASASADGVKYITFRTADGTEKSLSLAQEVEISFNDGKLCATTAGDEFTADLAQMASMWFSAEPTAIDALVNDSLAEGTAVRIYDMEGRLVSQYQHVQGKHPDVPAGNYILCVGNKATKVLVK